MEKYKCTVERTDSFIIEFDESVMNEEFLEGFRASFYDVYDLEELSEHISQYIARFGVEYIEGLGCPLIDGKKPYFVEERFINPAINVKRVIEDEIETYANQIR
ncbi:hypothetical protein [Kurthia sibirica]|uniref:Uncharacterized protein n=1 Tax=Kurthia sibirica TaxID=202750 RepID=A0A2U3AP83_9BACL|nr:hypothetical protein [Kurthia sibirica]PWI26344.1 hypothetical protein DEX24_03130 [Kurthia sibirica]GEK34844.1 hypothetical protein KSI01_23770 [Kurthia sibirica]